MKALLFGNTALLRPLARALVARTAGSRTDKGTL